MAQNAETAPTPPPPPAPSGGSKLIPIILITNLAMMAAVLVVVLRRPSTAAAHAAEPAAAESGGGEHGGAPGQGAPGPVLKLENFVIQLRGVDQDRYVRLAFDVEVMTEADRDTVQKRLAQIRDAVISYFSDRTLDELRGSDGIERTKTALIKRLDEIVPGRRIHALYITDFIIQ